MEPQIKGGRGCCQLALFLSLPHPQFFRSEHDAEHKPGTAMLAQQAMGMSTGSRYSITTNFAIMCKLLLVYLS